MSDLDITYPQIFYKKHVKKKYLYINVYKLVWYVMNYINNASGKSPRQHEIILAKKVKPPILLLTSEKEDYFIKATSANKVVFHNQSAFILAGDMNDLPLMMNTN